MALLVGSLGVWLTVWCGSAPAQKSVDNGPMAAGTSRQLKLLTAEIRHADAELRQLKQEVADVRQEIDEQIRQLEALTSDPQEQPSPVAKPAPREIKFRLPLAHVSTREETLFFVCEANRVTWIDQRALSAASDIDLLRQAAERVEQTGETETGLWSATRGAFDYRWEVKLQDEQVVAGVWISRRAGHKGETADEAAAATSEYARTLARYDPQTTRVVFAVRSDSFDVYRTLRSQLFELDFGVSWKPMTLDQRFSVGGSGGPASDL